MSFIFYKDIIKEIKSKEETHKTRFIPLNNWHKYYGFPEQSHLEFLVAHAKDNGFDEFKVIRGISHHVLIDKAALLKWLQMAHEKYVFYRTSDVSEWYFQAGHRSL